jgi:bacterial/archaeal transporter family-2 protein
MLIRLLWFLLVAFGGVALTVQAVWNARLRSATGSPVLTTMISVVITIICLALVWASGLTPRGSVPAFQSLPKWAWCGGICAVYYLVASLVALPRLGAATVFCLIIAGQMVAAIILDSTGAFDIPRISLTPSRVAGTVLLLAGVVLIQRR